MKLKKIIATFTFVLTVCSFLMVHTPANADDQKVFSVLFMNDFDGWTKDEVKNVAKYLAPYLTEKEIQSLKHQDLYGSETYIIKNMRSGPTTLHRVEEFNDKGEIIAGPALHSYKDGEILFFSCNPGDLPSTVVRYVDPKGKIYEYSPGVSGRDGSVIYNKYAKDMKK